ncbi:uncharacterized protein Tco_0270704 [Tanacetum coccineum]
MLYVCLISTIRVPDIEGAVGLMTWFENVESKLNITKCSKGSKVEFALVCSKNFKRLLTEEYCTKVDVHMLESEFLNHMMVGTEIDNYTTRFHQLARMVPHMVSTKEKRVDRYIWGLDPAIRGMVTSSNPTTIQAVVCLAHRLTNDVIRSHEASKGNDSGRKRQDDQKRNRGSVCSLQPLPHKNFQRCVNYRQTGHFTRNCQSRNGNDVRRPAGFERGSLDHLRNVFPKWNRAPYNNTGNQRALAQEFRPLLSQKSKSLNKIYSIEYANGHKYEAGEILLGCNLNLGNKLFDIDLILIKLKSFDIVVGIDWLTKVRAEIDCFRKIIRIPVEGRENLVVQGEKLRRDLKIVSVIEMQKYLERECVVFLAYVVDKDLKTYLRHSCGKESS